MIVPSTRFRQSIPNLSKGFTLIELLIAGVIALVILSVTLGLIVEQRRQFLGDQSKIDLNQDLRAASDFIGTDIKQVGERLEESSSIAVVRVLPGASANAPDTLILQRKLITEYLSPCIATDTDDTEITIADEAAKCNWSDDTTAADNHVNLTDSLDAFKDYRCDLDLFSDNCSRGEDDATSAALSDADDCDSECVYGYIYNPSDNTGEFFLYTDETYSGSTNTRVNKLQVIPLGESGEWTNTYGTDARIYILEEKKYALCEGVLQVIVNRRPDYDSDCPYPSADPKPIRLVDGIDDLQFRVQTSAGWQTSFNATDSTPTDDWQDIEKIEVSLETDIDERLTTETNTLILTSEFFPRNVLSR